MMNDNGPLVGIDVGSTRVSVVVGSIEDDRLVVRGCGQAGHDGARKGVAWQAVAENVKRCWGQGPSRVRASRWAATPYPLWLAKP